MKTLLASLCTAALLALSGPASASLITFGASLDGGQETPPTASAGTGTAFLTADTVAQTLAVSESFSGLTSGTTAGHLHVGPPGVAGPIILPFGGLPLGVTSASFSETFTAADLINQAVSGISTFAQLLTALEAGNTYVNIHTMTYPMGEIRGQVLPAGVPEPMTLTLLGAGLLGLAAARLRRAD